MSKQQSNGFPVERLREDFPILKVLVHGKPLVYLDNGATSQKPQVVIDRMKQYYEEENSNIHRGLHALSERATAEYEAARQKIAGFINAPSTKEIVFVRGTTEAINLVAGSYGRKFIHEGDEIVTGSYRAISKDLANGAIVTINQNPKKPDATKGHSAS